MRSKSNPYQRSLELKVIVREPTRDDLRAAYEWCVPFKERLSFEKALETPAFALALKNAAKATILRNGGR